ncbi:MAG: rhamnan synthesis F family protein [Cyclobacteriaceae bacterium]
MESICLFSCYLSKNKIPNFIKIYLKGISKYFSQTYLITHVPQLSKSDLDFLKSVNAEVTYVKNVGFDFGMYYQAISKISFTNCTRLAIVNDTNFLCGKLDPFFTWLESKSNLKMAGILDSNEIEYHLQSYFLVFQNGGVKVFLDYLEENGIIADRERVIDAYELGLTRQFKNKKLPFDSYFKVKYYDVGTMNPSYFKIEKLLKNGFPFIKKKLLLDSFSEEDRYHFKVFKLEIEPHCYLKIIRKHNPSFTRFQGYNKLITYLGTPIRAWSKLQ